MFQKDEAWSVCFRRKVFFKWCRWEQTGSSLELARLRAGCWSSGTTNEETEGQLLSPAGTSLSLILVVDRMLPSLCWVLLWERLKTSCWAFQMCCTNVVTFYFCVSFSNELDQCMHASTPRKSQTKQHFLRLIRPTIYDILENRKLCFTRVFFSFFITVNCGRPHSPALPASFYICLLFSALPGTSAHSLRNMAGLHSRIKSPRDKPGSCKSLHKLEAIDHY